MVYLDRDSHRPEESHKIIDVTGEVVVETQLRNVVGASVAFVKNDFAANEEGKVSWYRYGNSLSQIVVRVEKTGTNEGVLGDNMVQINVRAWGE